MRIFAQQPKATQQTTPAKPRTPGRANRGQSGEVSFILHLQGAIGNQAVQRLLEANTVHVEGDSTTTAIARFGHDFSGIPVNANRPEIQTKLTVNTPDDIYEQEADRIAEQVMATPAFTSESGAPPRIQRFSGQSNGQQTDAAPASVDQALASPGTPLEPVLRQDMEQRFGHDFSQVRVHAGGPAETSARDVNAHAYTVGHSIVFAAEQFAPGTREGRRLLAHELTHVVQQSGPNGQRADQSRDKGGLSPHAHDLSHLAQHSESNIVRRDVVRDSSSNPESFRFRIGHELTAAFAIKAKSLTAAGVLTTANIKQLKAEATRARDTVSDHERMFMAGLLDATNVATLRRTTINSTAIVTFALSTINDARMNQVIEAGRPVSPASVTKPFADWVKATGELDFGEMRKQLSEIETASEKEIRSLIGSSFRAQAAAVIAFAQARGVPLIGVLGATQMAASDNTPSDRLLAASAYVTAAAVGHPLASDLVYGMIHVDALDPAKFSALPGVNPSLRALYVAAAPENPAIAGLKGDTIYMPSSFDIENLNDRSNVIHELQHAQDDKNASPTAQPTFPAKVGLEATAYKAQGRYILDQMHGQTAPERARNVTQVARTIGELEMFGMAIEAKTDLAKYQPLVQQLFTALPGSRRLSTAQVNVLLAHTTARLESELQANILTAYGITTTSKAQTEGLAGESLIHWIHRL